MPRHGNIDMVWADGEHSFRLPIGQLRELQEKCDAGPQEISRRLLDGTWMINDVRETIRLGLVGGGMAPTDAVGLVVRYVDEWPLLDNVIPAHNILMAALIGVEDETVGKP